MSMERNLSEKILNEMKADHGSALERNFEIAKQLLRVTDQGKVDVLHKEKLTGKERILIYLIGKRYAKEAGLSEIENVDNKELMEELGIPQGSVLPWTMDLRDSNKIKQADSGVHYIPLNLVESILMEVAKKIGVG